MADTKISALPASTTPLAGTEVLPIVQSSTTKQVSVANLTAGRSFDALGMTLTSTDAGAAAAPLLELYRDSATPAASDTLGEIEFNGEDSAGNKQAYGLIHGSILSPTSTAEQGQLHFETATAGALTEKMIIGTTNLVINEIGAVFNVRIEGDTDANLFYTDATNSRIGVGTISPAEKLDVVGNIKSSGNLIVNAATTAASGSANITSTDASLRMSNTGGNADKNTYEVRVVSDIPTALNYLQIRKINDARTVFTELFKFDNAGDQTISLGNLVMGTSGKGIDFAATAGTGTSELLADYEEGTWTPVLGGTTSQSGQTYTRQLGQYTKVGRQVTVTWDVICSNVGTMSGNAALRGLPFTVGSSQGYRAGLAVGDFSGLASVVSIFSGLTVENSTDLQMRTSATAATGVAAIAATSLWANGTQLIGTITYFV